VRSLLEIFYTLRGADRRRTLAPPRQETGHSAGGRVSARSRLVEPPAGGWANENSAVLHFCYRPPYRQGIAAIFR
jgi:hypothetical protein